MTNLPISSKYRSTPALPVQDDEREALSVRLNKAFADGAIDSDAYRSHLDLLFAARTLGELVPVVEALPPTTTYDQPAIVAQQTTVEPGELVPARTVSIKTMLLVGAGILLALFLLIAVFGSVI